MMLTDEQITLLAELERDMDAGVQPFVVNHGDRWAFPSEIMTRFGLRSGQTVSDHVLQAIMRANIEALEEQVAAQAWPTELEGEGER